ncbi:hypothetical protein Q8A67_008690 [Cirrhinus molitorella]|uniref:Uncharacterized protein n=1 Tax=Cirrhinus molitorella TaxID=172907 RepID=A0AA88TQY4_9TELE|nr:hypothetical protein Q8A67_008690 [Cirrhinus molitorella]
MSDSSHRQLPKGLECSVQNERASERERERERARLSVRLHQWSGEVCCVISARHSQRRLSSVSRCRKLFVTVAHLLPFRYFL